MAQCVTECVAECDLQHNGSDLDNGEDSLQKKCPSGEAKAGFRKSETGKARFGDLEPLAFTRKSISFFLIQFLNSICLEEGLH